MIEQSKYDTERVHYRPILSNMGIDLSQIGLWGHFSFDIVIFGEAVFLALFVNVCNSFDTDFVLLMHTNLIKIRSSLSMRLSA